MLNLGADFKFKMKIEAFIIVTENSSTNSNHFPRELITSRPQIIKGKSKPYI
jgi:hypothetical protein